MIEEAEGGEPPDGLLEGDLSSLFLCEQYVEKSFIFAVHPSGDKNAPAADAETDNGIALSSGSILIPPLLQKLLCSNMCSVRSLHCYFCLL